MNTELSFHNVKRINIEKVKSPTSTDWTTITVHVMQSDGKITELTFYSVSGEHVSLGIGDFE